MDFAKLKVYRQETATARNLATQLKESPKGIDLALADMNCYGGKTRGWSSWILEESSRADYVERGLKKILSDKGAPLPKSIEAAGILWQRTGQTSWLTNLFSMVQRPGSPTVLRGRLLLITLVDFGDFRTNLDLPADKPITVSLDQFRAMIDQQTRTNRSSPTRKADLRN